jgi:hypothetical protein
MDINIKKKQTVATAHVGVSSSVFASTAMISYDYFSFFLSCEWYWILNWVAYVLYKEK